VIADPVRVLQSAVVVPVCVPFVVHVQGVSPASFEAPVHCIR
jgi:hypothetical protein